MSTNPRDLPSFVSYWGNRSNYQNVTIGSDIGVTGRIMPVRDIDDAAAPSSSATTARVLRGEDIAWLIENGKRLRVLNPSSSVSFDFSGKINKSDIQNVYNNLLVLIPTSDTWNDRLKRICWIDKGTMPVSENNKPLFYTWEQYDDSAHSKTFEHLIKQDNLYISNCLLSDIIRRLFFNTGRLNTAYADFNSLSTITSTERFSGTWHGKNMSGSCSQYTYGYSWSSTTDPTESDLNYTVQNNDLKVTFCNNLKGKIKNVSLFLGFSADCRNNNYQNTLIIYGDIRIDASRYSSSSQEIWTIPSEWKDARTLKNYTANAIRERIPSGLFIRQVDAYYNFVIFEIDTDSDLSGIGWNYAP